jgi:exosortase N
MNANFFINKNWINIFRIQKGHILLFAALCLFFLEYYFLLPGYMIIDITVISAILSFIYLLKPDYGNVGNVKYLILSILFLILTFITGLKTFYFFLLMAGLFYLIESYFGNTGNLPFWGTLLISPVFKYFNNMLGFPVRLQLSQWTGNVLAALGYKIQVIGNVIIKDGVEFSVDSVCVGLKMMVYSILAILILAAYLERKHCRFLSFTAILISIVIVILLNIISNFIRIVILTLFTIMPESPLHELVGIICFVLYVLIPSYFIVMNMGENIWFYSKRNFTLKLNNRTRMLLNLILGILIIVIGYFRDGANHLNKDLLKIEPVSGYSYQIVDQEVVKMEKPGILMYVKPISKFYGAEHNPMICWIGSGYTFKNINTQTTQGNEIYTGTLVKGNDKLYTAWWFENGETITIEQKKWRWKALQGEKFNLVNISSYNREYLFAEIKMLMKKNNKKS